ncbi:MAG: hypothetical protein AAF098_13390 [Pseudomonadota bacterium]
MSALTVIGALAKPVADMFVARSERKAAKDSLKAKAALAKQEDQTNVTLTDAEWETAAQSQQDNTWKDEFVTLCVMYPYIGLFAGTTYAAITGDESLLSGTMEGIKALQLLGVDVGELMWIVVLAAVGLKIWRRA